MWLRISVEDIEERVSEHEEKESCNYNKKAFAKFRCDAAP